MVMRILSALILAVFVFSAFSSVSYAVSPPGCPSGASTCFLCGGVGGIPCNQDCPSGPNRPSLGPVACECPQGEPCQCYCPYASGGATFQDDPSMIANAPPCEQPQSPSDKNFGVIEGLRNKVALKINGQWCLASGNLIVRGGTRVYVPADGYVRITLYDGSVVDVDQNSIFTLESLDTGESGATSKMIIRAAQGIFRYFQQSDRVEKFEVRMNSVCYTPKGTEYVVSTDGKTSTIKVLDGTVEAYEESRPTEKVLVEKGMMATIKNGSAPLAPVPFDPSAEPRFWESGNGCCGSAAILLSILAMTIAARRS